MNYHYRGVKLRQSRSPRDTTKGADTGHDEGPQRDTTKGADTGHDEGSRHGTRRRAATGGAAQTDPDDERGEAD